MNSGISVSYIPDDPLDDIYYNPYEYSNDFWLQWNPRYEEDCQ